MNPYLTRKREQFEAIRSAIQGVQTRAADENRDLTEDELRSVNSQAEEAKRVAAEIESLTEFETRSAAVGQLAASMSDDQEQHQRSGQTDGGQRSGSAAHTRDRDPGHYRSVRQGGQHSFFHDLFVAGNKGDQAARQRLEEHQRAVTVASGGTGIVPPRWLVDEYEAKARQTRVVANLVRNIPLGDDPRPMILPKQTGQTDANLATQTTEGANNSGWGTDRFTTDKDTLTPAAEAAYQDVSRQLLNSSSPAVDVLIMGDLRGAWDTKVESLVGAAILAGGTDSGITFATEAAFAANAAAIDAVVDASIDVAGDLRGPAELSCMSYRRFGAFRKLKDTTNRPLMPVTRYNPTNATGALGNVLVGDIEGTDAYGTLGIPATYPEKFAVLRHDAVILGESDLMEFTYDQVVGPSAVRMGIFGYIGVLIRHPAGVQLVTVTAATGS